MLIRVLHKCTLYLLFYLKSKVEVCVSIQIVSKKNLTRLYSPISSRQSHPRIARVRQSKSFQVYLSFKAVVPLAVFFFFSGQSDLYLWIWQLFFFLLLITTAFTTSNFCHKLSCEVICNRTCKFCVI